MAATPGPAASGSSPRRAVRDRHGRGLRGPDVLPLRPGRPAGRTARERFDALVLDVVTDIDQRWQHRLGLVEYAVEDLPQVPPDWAAEVPLSSLVRGSGVHPTRLVLFRRPIEHRCETRTALADLVRGLVVVRVAELLGVDADEVDRPDA